MHTVKFSLLLLIGGILTFQAQAGSNVTDGSTPTNRSALMAQNTPLTNTPPANNVIQRINPNSRQGSGPSVPGPRGPSTVPMQPNQGIDNGRIGNRYQRNQAPPQTLKPTAPSLQPRDKP